ncbi:hypothetical protein ACT1U9_10705 [Streptomyces sp. BR1]|uniref:hypothetical protein n=1 Tax=Streptomyces sp. BR1 TaxID=1592323 RepID=UPI00402B82C2
MPNCIVRIFEPLWRFLRPVPGRHWTAVPPLVVERVDTPTPPPPRVRVSRRVSMLRGEDTALVRPYLVAYEQLARRRALFLTVHGIDVGPLAIHGVVGR